MRTKFFRDSILTAIFILFTVSVFAQQTQIYVDRDAAFRQGQEFFEKQKYAEAQASFNTVVELYASDRNALTLIDAEYYAALCAMELYNKDAEALFEKFLTDHPESPKVHNVYFHLGRVNYRQKQWEKSIEWFDKVDIFDLSKEELHEYYFKRGYDYFARNNYNEAKKNFYEIRDVDTKYTPAANYYYSHILYTEGNYESALQGFQRLLKNDVFGPIVPYYIAQIYYMQGKYEDVITYAPPLLDSAKRAAEISRIIGESYFRTGRYQQSIPYLERYHKTGSGYKRDDLYELGYAYYKNNQFAEAVTIFQDAIGGMEDTLAQNIWYHLADCYVQTGDKTSARTAFGKASSYKFDQKIREDALFSYARLSYELSYSPFNEAIIALTQYINEFPNSSRKDEVNSFLVNVYLSTKNYKEALAAISQIKNISPTLQPAFQQVCYNRAVELYNNSDYEDAIRHFDKSLTYPISKTLNAQAKYWKGEAYYTQKKYDNAISQFKAFQYEPGAVNTPYFNSVNYSLGYAHHMKALQNSTENSTDILNFTDAATSFRKYVTSKTEDDASKVADAYLRLGDDYFMLRNDDGQRDKSLLNAVDFYGQAFSHNAATSNGKEYALFHKALTYGLLGKKQEKADALKTLVESFPNSAMVTSARLLQAQSYFDLGQYQNASDAYKKVLSDKAGDNKYEVLCLNQLGLIYYRQNDFTNSLDCYQKVASKAKGTSTGSDAAKMVKAIYIARGQVDEWESWASTNGYSESGFAADSTLYGVIAKQYADGQCDEVLKNAAKYVSKYPSGNFIIDVMYKKGECHYKNGDNTNALGCYTYILDKPKSDYTERAASVAAYITYTQKDYTKAAKYYEILERSSADGTTQQSAQINIMRCYLYLAKFDTGYAYADKVIQMKGITDKSVYQQAYYVRGRYYYNHSNYDLAVKDFDEVAKRISNELAIESKYYLCEIQHRKGDYKTAEKSLFKFIGDNASSKLWKGHGLLLLADNYLAQKDTFKAETVLKDYVQRGEIEDLRKKAQDKLDLINTARSSSRIRKPEDDLIIPIDNGGTDMNKLLDNNREQPKEGGDQ